MQLLHPIKEHNMQKEVSQNNITACLLQNAVRGFQPMLVTALSEHIDHLDLNLGHFSQPFLSRTCSSA
jgi:hypothetical protein